MRLEDCTRLERRRLKRYVCGLCEIPLDRNVCAAFGEKCSEQVRNLRRADCLKAYRPRAPRAPQGSEAAA